MSTKNHNICPACKKTRRPGDLSHGKCMEQRAVAEGKAYRGLFVEGKRMSVITQEMVENSRRKAAAKRYLSGNLPPFMYT